MLYCYFITRSAFGSLVSSILDCCRVWSLCIILVFPFVKWTSMYFIKCCDIYHKYSILVQHINIPSQRHSNIQYCCIVYMCPCGWFAFSSWGSSLNSELPCCGQMDLIFLTLLELDCPLENCFFIFENPQTSDLTTDNKISKRTKKV